MFDVKAFVESIGGPAAVARMLKSDHERGHISTAAVSKWVRIPAEHCIQLSKLSRGRFTPEQMRPDIFGPAPRRRKAA
jgi:DNA-binding transcriptional regulator YdaS (Cro superfamily)